MKHVLLTLSAILLLSALVACGGGSAEPAAPTSAGDVAAGKVKFDGTCISCHGPDAKGLPNLGKDLTISEFVKSKTDDEMVAFLQVGRSSTDPLNTVGIDMPPRGGNPALTDADLLNIVAYVRSLQQ